MAGFLPNGIQAQISGLVTEVPNSKDNAIWYKVQVVINEVFWQVERRYSDFEGLNKKLIESQGILQCSMLRSFCIEFCLMTSLIHSISARQCGPSTEKVYWK